MRQPVQGLGRERCTQGIAGSSVRLEPPQEGGTKSREPGLTSREFPFGVYDPHSPLPQCYPQSHNISSFQFRNYMLLNMDFFNLYFRFWGTCESL